MTLWDETVDRIVERSEFTEQFAGLRVVPDQEAVAWLEERARQGVAPGPFRIDQNTVLLARRAWDSAPTELRTIANAGVLLGAGAVSIGGLLVGDALPDEDISLLGIGMHRFWLLHSALAAWAARDLLEGLRLLDEGSRAHPRVAKLCAAAAMGGAVGIGIHLSADGMFGLFGGEKSVVFGVPGIYVRHTLIPGTYLDDDLWLLGNSAWAFKIAHDIAVVAFAEEEDSARRWASATFQPYIDSRRAG